MKAYRVALVLGFLLAGSDPAAAQITKRAQAGFRFLENPISAEAVGRGGVGVTMLRNASALFWNPAGTGWIDGGIDAGLHYTFGIADIDQLSAAVAGPVADIGVFGASLTHMSYGTFYLTRRAQNEAGYLETGTFSPQAFAFGLSFARAMSDRFAFGVQLKLARQDLGQAWIAPRGEDGATTEPRLKDYALTVPAFDVGASYDFQAYGLTFGAAVQNISQEVRYENEQFPLPFSVRFSMTLSPLALLRMEQAMHDVVIAAETSKGRDFGEKIQFGAEYRFMDSFVVRGGYMGGYTDRGLTLGAGLRHRGIRFDYAYQRFGVFGGIQLLSLSHSFGGRGR